MRAVVFRGVGYDDEHPVETIKRLTGGIGVDRVIDAVGVDAEHPRSGRALEAAEGIAEQFDAERAQTAPDARSDLPFEDIIDAYEAFDRRDAGCVKVALSTEV